MQLNDAQSKLGEVGKLEDGRSFVKFERHLPHPVARVWAALEDPAQRRLWFPGFELELREGSAFDIWFGGECEGPAHVSGTVTVCEPERVLECEGMRWELTPDGADACVLTFTDVLQFDESRSAAEHSNLVLAGWHNMMDFLEQALSGQPVDLSRPEPDYSVIDVPGRE